MAKKRVDGEGNIRKRTNHSWEASIKVDDKRRYLYGKTQKEVKEKLSALQNEIYNDPLIDESDTTVEEWMNTLQVLTRRNRELYNYIRHMMILQPTDELKVSI